MDQLERDWQLYRKYLPRWQGNYINNVNKEIMLILADNINPSSKFWKIDELIKNAKKNPGVIVYNSSRSKLYNIMIDLAANGVITEADITEFSNYIKETLEPIFNRK